MLFGIALNKKHRIPFGRNTDFVLHGKWKRYSRKTIVVN